MIKKRYGSVLLVDDDRAVRNSTSEILKGAGFVVVTAAQGQDAMKLFQAASFDAVLTDIVMPDTNGIELMEKIHSVDNEIPVILMTGYADMEKAIKAVKGGAFDFITKPLDYGLLVSSLDKALHYRKLLQMENDYKRLLEEFNQEIESLVSERVMSLMALTIADKIRNPISIIGMTCNRVFKKGEIPGDLRGYLEQILGEVTRIDAIVQEFQSLLKSRKSVFTYDDMSAVVRSSVMVVESEVADKGVGLEVRLPDYPIMVNLEKSLFRYVLLQLLRNAIEATPVDGTITVSASKNNEEALLSISDTGHGIGKDDIDKIFDPMYSTKGQRFGMGLPLIKQIVSEHMGRIEVASTPGEGTTFHIRIPLRWSDSSKCAG